MTKQQARQLRIGDELINGDKKARVVETAIFHPTKEEYFCVYAECEGEEIVIDNCSKGWEPPIDNYIQEWVNFLIAKFNYESYDRMLEVCRLNLKTHGTVSKYTKGGCYLTDIPSVKVGNIKNFGFDPTSGEVPKEIKVKYENPKVKPGPYVVRQASNLTPRFRTETQTVDLNWEVPKVTKNVQIPVDYVPENDVPW